MDEYDRLEEYNRMEEEDRMEEYDRMQADSASELEISVTEPESEPDISIIKQETSDGVNSEPGVICLYRYFEIFLLILISFPTAKSFLQRIFTPKIITYKSYISS